MKLRNILFQCLLLTFIAFYGFTQNPIPIQEARSRPLGSEVTIEGIITNGPELGNIRYIQDATGGLALFGNNIRNIRRGDRVIATGKLKDFNNLLELDPVNSFRVISSNNPLPPPRTITPNLMNESLESQLIRIENATIREGNGTNQFSANQTYTFVASNQQGIIYIRSGHPLVGTLIPTCPVDLVGINSQFYDNYQLLLRDSADIQIRCPIFFTQPLEPTQINTSNLTLEWQTNITGTSFIRYGKTPNLELGIVAARTNNTIHTVSFSTEPATIYYVQAFSITNRDTAKSPIEVFVSKSLSSGKILAYFNRPVDTSVSTGKKAQVLHRSIDDTLIAYIRRARQSIDMAIYNFNNDGISNISQALNEAYRRGVKIRVIHDESTFSKGVMDLFGEIPRLGRPEGRGIMHNKFIIFDADATDPNLPIVWTGSTNLTDKQINEDENNVIIIQDQSLAKVFKLEFEEMWGSNSLMPNRTNAKFGAEKVKNTPQVLNIGGKKVECHFSPTDGTNAKILSTISAARNSAYAAIMVFTRTELSNALINHHNSGKDVKVILNDTSSEAARNVYSSLRRSLQNKARFHCFPEIFHHKYFIRDPEPNSTTAAVLTGSHNWSATADNFNDENTLIIHDQEIANLYYQEFSQRFKDLGNDCPPTFLSESQENNSLFSIYPNPSNGYFNINFNLTSYPKEQSYLLKIIDPHGKEAFQKNIFFHNTPGTQTLELNLKPGIYIITFQTAQGIHYQKIQIIE
ncbi:MAG: phospholipase D-like domain-containing protein [Bacteroidia bacterium]|nr:phospholipase D-like domain-containing protein [Bacteroidia bacterium]